MISPQFQIQKEREIQQRGPEFRLEASEITETLFDVPSPKIRKGKYSVRFYPMAREVWLKGWLPKHSARALEPVVVSYVPKPVALSRVARALEEIVQILKEERFGPTTGILKREEQILCIIDGKYISDVDLDVPTQDKDFWITWLAPSIHYREEIYEFERNVLFNLTVSYKNINVQSWHLDRSRDKIESILEGIKGKKLSFADLPVLILSKNRLGTKEEENIVIIYGEFMEKLLELPEDIQKRLIEKIYRVFISEPSNLNEAVMKVIKDEIKSIEKDERTSKHVLEFLKEAIKAGIGVIITKFIGTLIS